MLKLHSSMKWITYMYIQVLAWDMNCYNNNNNMLTPNVKIYDLNVLISVPS